MKQTEKERIYNEQQGRCFFCEREFPLSVFTFDHLLPRSLSGDDASNNIVLSCPECNMRRANKMPFREIELVYFIKQLLDKHPDFRNITQEALLSNEVRYRADILAEQKIKGKWEKILIELKSVPTFTSKRLKSVVDQLNTYKTHIKGNIKLVFSFPGILPKTDNDFLEKSGIEIWDRDYIVKTFEKEVKQTDDKLFQKFFSYSYVKPKIEDTLLDELKAIPAGRNDWSKYQKQIGKILSYLFSDTLSDPITELPDKYGINRRDFILRNYREEGLEIFKRKISGRFYSP